MKTVRWGILGCGAVCERKSGPGMYKTPHSELVAAMRRNPAQLEDFARRHGVRKTYTDADALIADPEVDIVYVATPHDSHRDLALRVLRAGKPVYIEKPMAMNAAEAEEILAAAGRAGQPVFVALYRRALPYFRKVRELLDAGTIGTPQTVEMRFLRPASASDRDAEHLPWRLRPEQGGDGYFYDLAPHMLDILDFLLGEIDDARGYKTNLGGLYAASDTVAATLHFRSGAAGTALWNFVAPETLREDAIVIAGSRGTIRFSSFRFDPIEVTTAAGVERYDIAPPEHIQQPLIRTIVDQLRGEPVRCPSTGETALRTVRIMDRIMETRL